MSKHALTLSLLLAAGCAHAPKEAPAGATGAAAGRTQDGARQAGTSAAAQTSACRTDMECPSGQLCVQGACQAVKPGLAECAEARVHFDFDSTEIKGDEKVSLERIARCLKGNQAMQITIRGNADERGTQEYNLALGDRRANAVARYLENLGVSTQQLQTVSYGKERPLCAEHTESCWQQNRRAGLVFQPTKK
jgi:peptidoglycan-associated lipoprotein